MKTKKFFACMVCVVAMGLTACAGGEDDSAGIQTLQPEQIYEEETNDRQEDIQETEQDKNERKWIERNIIFKRRESEFSQEVNTWT